MSHGDDCYIDSGPLPGLRAGRGARHTKELKIDYEVNQHVQKTRTSLSVVLFDMVAELAIEFA
eukprot:3317408-Amphidinium_carterae.1